MRVCENLKKARKLIRKEKNWNKGSWHDKEYRALGILPSRHTYCLLGAVNIGAGRNATESWGEDCRPAPEVRAIMKALNLTSVQEVFYWNDSYDTTHADVLALLDNTIAECEDQ